MKIRDIKYTFKYFFGMALVVNNYQIYRINKYIHLTLNSPLSRSVDNIKKYFENNFKHLQFHYISTIYLIIFWLLKKYYELFS